MNCGERSGFLFAHACDHPAIETCDACRKRICEAHQRVSGARTLCVTCWQAAEPGAVGSSHDPYLYGGRYGYSPYDAGDHAAFGPGRRSSSDSAAAGFEGDADGT